MTGAPPALGAEEEVVPGTLVGLYRIESRLAAGGGGTVYVAAHPQTGERVAVKVLNAELATTPEAVRRFILEAQVTNKLRHPNIVDILEFGLLADGRPFMVMELLKGTTVRTLVARQGARVASEALGLLEPVCAALGAAHAQGVVHRDLTATNVHVEFTPEGPRVKLLDFGIAKLLYPEPGSVALTAIGTVLGTPYSMAPEQARGEAVDSRTDIYALGVLTHFMLTGHYPFAAATRQEIVRMTLELPAPRPSARAPVSPAVDEVVLTALKKDASQRFQSVGEFIAALRAAVWGTPEPATGLRAAPAVGVYVELKVEGADAADEAVLDDCADLLDQAEQTLRAAGLVLPLQTGSSILAVLVLTGSAEAQVKQRDDVAAIASRLAGALAERSTARPALHLEVTLHVDRALVRGSGEIGGGAIVNVSTWGLADRVAGLGLTTAAVQAGVNLASR